ncbi:MAG: dipeptidase [candidate division KSB1 bacterium]|nr:dipeptidase [candidate division KSB1 bacterium]MDZ7301574.1 dipeptidase [candidate division KSB1 bacterium]MDZ7311010.1 dipeptidase [candidate division KSB1 bacterium]
MTKKLCSIALVAALLLSLFFFVLPVQFDRMANRALRHSPYTPSERALALHQRLLIADLHCDALLWDRHLLKRNSRGTVDIPRLIEGNVALQAFTVVTKVPPGINFERNSDRGDLITLLVMAQRWPIATWGNLRQRAIYQAKKLCDAADHSEGKLVLIKTAAELQHYLNRRQQDQNITAGFLGIEGAQVLEGELANLDVLFDAGFRMMSPTHFFDTEVGGSAHGLQKGGLTIMGRKMIKRMEEKKMIVDLAHASARTIDDVLAIATRPVVVSHTGVKGTCDNIRNLSDDQIRRIAQTGGVIGIAYFEMAVCGGEALAIAKAIRHAVNLAGIEHVGLGSDFDGAVATPFDAAGLVQLTDALLAEGFSESEIGLIMGENVLRILGECLP